jgi:hypothetical protein
MFLVGLLLLCAVGLAGASAVTAAPMQLMRADALTPRAPICPSLSQTQVGNMSCFPQHNGNQSQNGSGLPNAEINGATLSGPTVLSTGPCPASSYPSDAWCTPSFTLGLSVPGSGAAKYFGGFGLLGAPLAGTSVPRQGNRCPSYATQCLHGESLSLANEGYAADQWCANSFEYGPAVPCPSWVRSDPLRISGRGSYATMEVCALGLNSLITTADVRESFTACIQVQLSTVASRTNPSSGLTVALAGQKGPAPNTVAVTMTLTNTGSSDISGLTFTDPRGLENNGVLISNGNIGPTRSGLTWKAGPTPALPSTLRANSPPEVLHYTYTATSAGGMPSSSLTPPGPIPVGARSRPNRP